MRFPIPSSRGPVRGQASGGFKPGIEPIAVEKAEPTRRSTLAGTNSPRPYADVLSLYPKLREPRDTETVEFIVPSFEHGGVINDLYRKAFGIQRSLAHYLWKYWDNPAGPPVGSFAREKSTGHCLATSIGQRRRASVAGRDSFGALLCEVASDPELRGGGRLWREVMNGFSMYSNDVDGVHWAYGGQSTDEVIKMGARWFGYRVIFHLVTWEIRLSTRAALRHHLARSLAWLTPVLAPVLDFAIRTTWRKRECGISVKEIEKFGPEFDELWERFRNLYPVCFCRDAATLNWRYVHNPVENHRIVEARHGGKLLGYLVWRESKIGFAKIATVLDFWHGDDLAVIRALLDATRRKARLHQCSSLRFALKEGRPEHQVMESLRFCRRSPYEEVDKIICTPIPGSHPYEQAPEVYELLRTVLKSENWFYTQGDCDFRD